MRVAPAIELSSEVRLESEKLSRRRTKPVRVVHRSRIILPAADVMQNKEIVQLLGVAPASVAHVMDKYGGTQALFQSVRHEQDI
jgi:hypothetical protein